MVPPDPFFDAWNASVAGLTSVQTWEANFSSLHGHAPDPSAKYAYNSTLLLLQRIDDVADVDSGSNLVIQRAELLAAVRNSFGFNGVTGVINLNAAGDRVNPQRTAFFGDAFSQTTIHSAWSWLQQDPTRWSLTARPGFLRITTQQSVHNMLLQPAPARDYEARIRLQFTPSENFQIAGLLLRLSDGNSLVLGRAYCNMGPPLCEGNGIYFDHIENSSFVPPNYATATSETTETYLRILRSGNVYTGYFSANGVTWTEIGAHTLNFTPTQVGLIASNQNQMVGEIPADFDFFVLESANLLLYMPWIAR